MISLLNSFFQEKKHNNINKQKPYMAIIIKQMIPITFNTNSYIKRITGTIIFTNKRTDLAA